MEREMASILDMIQKKDHLKTHTVLHQISTLPVSQDEQEPLVTVESTAVQPGLLALTKP